MGYLKINVRLTKRGFLVLFIPYLAASTWYYLFYNLIAPYVSESLGVTSQIDWVNICFNFSIAFSILISGFFVDKVDKLRVIYVWAIIMPIVTILLMFTSDVAYVLALVSLLGALFGTSLLAYFVYLRDLTNIEERGRVSGTMVFLSLLLFPFFLGLTSDFSGSVALCVFLGIGTFIIYFLKPREKAKLTTKKRSTPSGRSVRTFLYYLIPWFIFCMINATLDRVPSTYLSSQFSEVSFQAQFLKYLAASFGALVGGISADWMGRRVTLAIGVASYGISNVLIGLVSTAEVYIILTSVNGLSWGIFLVVYTLVVWGDLASTKKCAPFYAAGLLPFYFSTGFRYLVASEILNMSVMHAALMSSLLIFLSNVPIILAKELVPQDIINEMNIRRYIQRVKNFLKKKR